ncbi:MAG: ABC transporter permease subunit [Promethearchaeota archaeon]
MKGLKKLTKNHFFFISTTVLGSFLVLLVVLALVDMFVTQLVMNFPNFLDVLNDGVVLESVFLTFFSAFLATLVTMFFGVPLAYLIARYEFRGKVTIESLMNLPLMIPHSVAGIMIYALFMRKGVLGAPLSELGITFEDSLPGIVVAMLFVSMPIFVNTMVEGFKSVDPKLERVATSLGATQFQAFTKVSLPLARRHMVTGAVMCWARGISTFGAVILIAYYPMVAPVLVYYRFNTQGLEGSGPIAVLLITISLAIFVVLYAFQEYSKNLVYGERT